MSSWPRSGEPESVAGLELQLASRPDELERARQALGIFLAAHAVSPQTVYGVELVLEEIFMNAIRYAFTDGREHALGLRARVRLDEVILQFRDDGVAFDPLARPEPVKPRSIEEAVPGGLGLMLVRRFAKSIEYRRSDGWNGLTVTLNRVEDGQARAPARG